MFEQRFATTYPVLETFMMRPPWFGQEYVISMAGSFDGAKAKSFHPTAMTGASVPHETTRVLFASPPAVLQSTCRAVAISLYFVQFVGASEADDSCVLVMASVKARKALFTMIVLRL